MSAVRIAAAVRENSAPPATKKYYGACEVRRGIPLREFADVAQRQTQQTILSAGHVAGDLRTRRFLR